MLKEDANYLGILRDAMICFNSEKYFKNAWDGKWLIYSKDTYDVWVAGGADTEIIKKHVFEEESMPYSLPD